MYMISYNQLGQIKLSRMIQMYDEQDQRSIILKSMDQELNDELEN